jgi:HD-GYP domain-containing protein (c-di-GMP phosphodiesterase class II)
MVRFSDIIKIKDKTGSKEKLGVKEILTPEPVKEDKLWLSDSQIFKVSEENIFPETTVSINTNLEIVTYYEKFLERAIESRERVKKDQGISPSPILADLHYIIDNNLIDEIYEYAMSTPDDYEQILVHTVEVTFSSLRVGKGMGYDTKELLKLGLAGFLENVGMYKIPDYILNKERKLEKQETAIIKNHPEVSHEILSRMGKRYDWLADTALQTHERTDGSGYPRGLRGDEISELASIIGLIDTYVAMIKKRPYRDKLIQTDAIKLIVQEAKGLFPHGVLKMFLNQISLFPIGTHVKLNNKTIGRVISTETSQPLRPTVELLYDSEGKKLGMRKVIRLADNPLLYITGSIGEKEIPSS